MVNVVENIVKILYVNGIDCVYGILGDLLNGFMDVFCKDGMICWVYVWYEEFVVFVVVVDVVIMGEFVVVVGFCGLGNLYFINGFYDVNCFCVFVFVIVVYIFMIEIGIGYF